MLHLLYTGNMSMKLIELTHMNILGLALVLLLNYILRRPFRDIGLDGDTGCLIYPAAHYKKGETLFKNSWIGYNYFPVILYWLVHRLYPVKSYYKACRNFFTIYVSLTVTGLYFIAINMFSVPVAILASCIFVIVMAHPIYYSYYGPKEFFIILPLILSYVLFELSIRTANPYLLFTSVIIIVLGAMSIKPHFTMLSIPFIISVFESGQPPMMGVAVLAGYVAGFLVVFFCIALLGNIKEYLSYFFTFLRVITPKLPVSRIKLMVQPVLFFVVMGVWGCLRLSVSGNTTWAEHLIIASFITSLVMIFMFQKGEWPYLYLPVFPFLSILASAQIMHFIRNFHQYPLNWLLLTGLILLFIQTLLTAAKYYTLPPEEKDRVWKDFLPQHEGIVNKHVIEELVSIIKRESSQNDYIAILGHTPQVYTLANRRSAMRCLQVYNIYYHLYPNWQELFIKNVREKKPILIISNCSWYRTINMEHLEILTGIGYRFLTANETGGYKIFKHAPEKQIPAKENINPFLLLDSNFHQPTPSKPMAKSP